MTIITKVLSFSIVSLLAGGIQLQAVPCAPQDPPPAQTHGSAQDASAPRMQGPRGGMRPGVFGKLTAVHDQSIEITDPEGIVVTVKISDATRFRKDRADARLSDFKVGDVVFVRGEENPDHTWNAEMIGERSGGGFMGAGPAGRGSDGGRRGGAGGMRQMGVLGKDYVFGEVKSVDAPNLTILRPDNVTQTVELNEETSLRKGRESVTMADIQTGDHVFVRGEMKDNAFQPRTVMVIGPEQWKRMQDMGFGGGPGANPPKGNNPQQKPPEQPH